VTWQLASFVILGLVIAAGFGWYERSHPSARVLALVSALAALAIAGRLAFAALPNVKPTTDIVLLSGHALGAVPGFAVGAVTALVSNVFFGQGPWTPWQMAGWGGVGAAGGALAWLLRGRELGRWSLAVVCGLAGLVFSLWMDVYQWTYAAERTLDAYLAIAATSLPYTLAHAVGNVVFCLLVGPAFVRAVARYRRRFAVRWRPAPAAAACAAVALAVAGTGVAALSAPARAEAATAASRAALRYLDRAQNPDGGFGGAPRQSSTQLHTGWVALGLAAAGRNPQDVSRRGRSVIDYVKRNARSLDDTGELERTILVLRASGLSPRRFAGRDLVRLLLRRRARNGSWGGLVNHTAFGILALAAAGEPRSRLRASARWLEEAQSGDGGYGVTPGGTSDVDDTAAVLQALAVAGRGRSPAARRALGYLRRSLNRDGGWGQMPGRSSNAQSTAWAIQGLVAVGRNPAKLRSGRNPFAYLRSLQGKDGAIRYSRQSAQTPVWVTATALLGLERKPFPLATVKRRPRKAASAPAPAAKAPAPPSRTDADAAEAEERAVRELEAAKRKPRSQARVQRPVIQREQPAEEADQAPAAAEGGDEGPSAPVVAGVLAGAAALVLGGRHWWRRRHGVEA
jgi:energy-coupling factor transport system substrate-specific component